MVSALTLSVLLLGAITPLVSARPPFHSDQGSGLRATKYWTDAANSSSRRIWYKKARSFLCCHRTNGDPTVAKIMEFRASFSAQAATIRNAVVLRQRRCTLVKLPNYNVVNGDSEWSNKALDTAYSTTWCEFNLRNTAPNEIRINEG
ncbi:hypothetical protein FPQ18DRAFT_301294 [Pyronema domesticum]|nr:hypothetical protein FPQ18DRAFT_301294 [Pyronema domesticum]